MNTQRYSCAPVQSKVGPFISMAKARDILGRLGEKEESAPEQAHKCPLHDTAIFCN